MAKANSRALKMLSTALQMEEKGAAFYKKATGNCKTAQGKDIFKMLMADELVHKQRIKKIYKTIQAGGEWSDEWKSLKVNPKKLDTLFKGLKIRHGKDMKSEITDIRAMDVGIDLELKSITFYEKNHTRAPDAPERNFLSRMIKEERGHYRALSDMKSYLIDPVGWFREKERTHLDGMT